MAITSASAEYRGNHTVLTWDWATGVTPSACTYDVQRCGSENFAPSDGIETIASGISSASFEDYDITTKDLWRKMAYRIVTHITSGADYLSDAVTYGEGYVDRIVQDIRYRLNVGLTRAFGTPILVFIRKTDGVRCSNCWDEILQRCTRDHCPICFGQGFISGFYAPISSWMQIQPTSNSPSIDPQGIDQKNVTQGIMPYTPYITYGDMIMDMDNNLYTVINAQATIKSGAIAHQIIGIRLLNRDAVEYRIIQTLMSISITRDSGVPLLR